MKKAYCDVCGAEMCDASWANDKPGQARNDKYNRLFNIIGSQDICKDCGAAFAEIDMRRELKQAILKRRGLHEEEVKA